MTTEFANYDEWKDDPKIVDELLSKELLQLSLKDRNDIQEEIHGVHCLAPEETPEMVNESLKKLATELDDDVVLPSNQKQAYLQSQKLETTTTTYINEQEFRLRFLRCELFDISKTAKRMAHFLDLVLELFGDFALERPIRLSDFTKAEMKYMRRARYQFLPYRDRSGRRIIIIFPGEALETVPPKIKVRKCVNGLSYFR